MQKCKTMPLCPVYTFILENTVIFHKKVLFIFKCNGFIIVTLKWTSKYFKVFWVYWIESKPHGLLKFPEGAVPSFVSRSLPTLFPLPQIPSSFSFTWLPSPIPSLRWESDITSSRKPALMPLVSPVLPPLSHCPLSERLASLFWCVSPIRFQASLSPLYAPPLAQSLALSKCSVNFGAEWKVCDRWIDIIGGSRVPM